MKSRLRMIALTGMLLPSASVAAGEAEKQRFLNEYPAAAKRLQDRFAQVKGTLTVRENISPGSGETRTARVTFAVDAGHHKLERQSTRQLIPSGRQEITTVICAGPEDGFTLRRLARDKPFEITGRDQTKAQRQFRRDGGNDLFSSFQLMGYPLTYFLDQTELKSVEPLPDGQGGGLRVTLINKMNQPTYVDLDPTQGWIIRRVEVLVGPPPGSPTPKMKPLNAVTIIDYQGKDSATGLPLPKTVRQQRMGNLASTTTIDTLRFEPTPPAEFTLAHYGVDAPPSPPKDEAAAPTGSGPLLPWLVGLGIAAMAVALVLYRLATRSRSPLTA